MAQVDLIGPAGWVNCVGGGAEETYWRSYGWHTLGVAAPTILVNSGDSTDPHSLVARIGKGGWMNVWSTEDAIYLARGYVAIGDWTG